MNRILAIFTMFVACFFFSPVAMAASAEEAPAAEAPAAEETKAADAEAEEAKPEEAVAEEAKEETKAADDAKADTDAAAATDTEGAADTDGEEVDLVSTGEEAVAAFKSGEFALALSALLMLFVGAARRFKLLEKLPRNAVPWVSASLGVAAVLALDLSTGGALSVERVLAGLMAGLAASGMWSLIGKHVPWLGNVKA